MTVRELIAKLAAVPDQDTTVVVPLHSDYVSGMTIAGGLLYHKPGNPTYYSRPYNQLDKEGTAVVIIWGRDGA